MTRKRRVFSKKQASSAANWDYSLKVLLASVLGVSSAVYAETPLGLIGGQTTDTSAYAAYLSNPSGAALPISGLPSNATIESVGMNSFGAGLLGGQINSSIPYAASVAPDGTLTVLTLSMSAGNISSVAINESGSGLIGGRDNGLNRIYLAQVSPDGTVNTLSVPSDVLEAVSLNDSNVGLIAGEGSAIAYAAYVASDGTITQVANTPSGISHLHAAAINNLGTGIIGGRGDDFNSAYAAFVTPGGLSPVVLNPTPSGFAVITTVAINEAGSGLIGGSDAGSNAYAGYASSDGSVITLFGSPFPGSIRSVSLNTPGTGLIGGQNGANFYAAFVGSDGTLTPLFSSSTAGIINSVAINDAGLGLIGGQTGSSEAYLALVAPNGTLTPLDVLNGYTINSLALQSRGAIDPILSQATPQSVGPYGSALYMHLSAAAALENRFIQQNRLWVKNSAETGSDVTLARHEMNLAYHEIDSVHPGRHLALNPKSASTPQGTGPAFKENSIWLEPFGDFIHVEEEGSIPSFTNEVGGALLGYDRQGSNYIVGVTLGYAFNYVDYSKNLGHGKIQEEMASLYGSYYSDHFWFAAALWGGVYQLTNERHTLSQITSKGKTHGWILDPHLELASPWAIDDQELYYIEPFVQFDWVNNWQRNNTETGSSGLNVHVPSIYNSLLQSEAGLRFYERFMFCWGDFCLEEKLSYINLAPFEESSANLFFVGSASSFPAAVGSLQTQNLGGVQILGCFIPRNTSTPYGGFSFEASLGSSYQSYFVSIFGGKDF